MKEESNAKALHSFVTNSKQSDATKSVIITDRIEAEARDLGPGLNKVPWKQSCIRIQLSLVDLNSYTSQEYVYFCPVNSYS
nr:expressed protein [Hymenolepis microstoma]